MALSDRLGNMGYQYLKSQGLTNTPVDLAMMQENVNLYGKQSGGVLQEIEKLEQQAQKMIYDSMEQGQIPAYFLKKHLGDSEAARKEHATWVSDMENRRRVRQQNWLTAEDIYKIGGEQMLDQWVNWSDAAPSFLGKGKWADMASMPIMDDPIEGLSFQPQVRTIDPDSGQIHSADMTVDGEPEGTSPSVGFLPFSELDTFMDQYKSTLSLPAGAKPIYGSIPIFDRDTSRLDTMSAYQAATGQQDELQVAAEAAKARAESMEQTLIDEPARLEAEEIAAAEVEAEAAIAQRETAAVSAEEAARTAERGYSLDLEPGGGATVKKADGTTYKPLGKDLSNRLPFFDVGPWRGTLTPLRQKKRKVGDAWKGLSATDIAKYPEGYIQSPGSTPFWQNLEQWDSLTDSRRAELTAIAKIGTEATLKRGVVSAIGNGKVFVAGAAGGAKQYKNSALYQKQLEAEKGKVEASEQFKDVRSFYQSEDGNLTQGGKLYEFFKGNPEKWEEFTADPHKFAVDYKDNLDGLYGPEVTKEEAAVLDAADAEQNVPTDPFMKAVRDKDFPTIQRMLDEANELSQETDNALIAFIEEREGNLYNWTEANRKSAMVQIAMTLPQDDVFVQSLFQGDAMRVLADTGNFSNAGVLAKQATQTHNLNLIKEQRAQRNQYLDEQKFLFEQFKQQAGQLEKAGNFTTSHSAWKTRYYNTPFMTAGGIGGFMSSKAGGFFDTKNSYARRMKNEMREPMRLLTTELQRLNTAKQSGNMAAGWNQDMTDMQLEIATLLSPLIGAMSESNQNFFQKVIRQIPVVKRFVPDMRPGAKALDISYRLVAFDKNSQPTFDLNKVDTFGVMRSDGVTLDGPLVPAWPDIADDLGDEGMTLMMELARSGTSDYINKKK